jgi:6-pyruvoyltetrahydropterin/6-carboxytetrahydropterin synthase
MSCDSITSFYTVAVQRNFVARHFLFGGDWGPENQTHSHHYKVEVRLEGRELDQHGYLVDIVDIESRLDELVAHFRDQSLNELPEFKSLNPSIEHLSRIFCEEFAERITASNIHAVSVQIWENDIAWASYRRERH